MFDFMYNVTRQKYQKYYYKAHKNSNCRVSFGRFKEERLKVNENDKATCNT